MTEARQQGIWRLMRPVSAMGAIFALASGGGCADSEEAQATTGTAGSGGSGGFAGVGGSAGKAGASAGGTGGASAGGAGGAGGSAGATGGSAGTGGSTGGTAGKAGSAGTAGTAGAGGSAGTGGTGGVSSCVPGTGDGTLATLTKVADGSPATFVSPFDAVPSPDGKTIFFTAISTATGEGSVYSVPAMAGGMVTKLAGGMVSPLGIAINKTGTTLYIADPGAAEDPASFVPAMDKGLLYTMPVAGGTPTVLVKGGWPHSVTVGTDGTCKETIYYGGVDASGPGVFTTTGMAAVLQGGAGSFGEASGIAVAGDGTIYVHDAIGPTRRGSIWSGKSGKATELAGSIWGGFPGGIALSSDEKNLVFSGLDQASAGSDTLTRFAIATPAMQTKQANAAAGKEAGGLHRAFNVDVYAFVDGQGTNGAGSIWALSKLAFSEE